MSSGQDVSEFLDILGLVKSYFSSYFSRKKKIEIFFFGAPDAPEDQAICLFAGLLANPDMALSPHIMDIPPQYDSGPTVDEAGPRFFLFSTDYYTHTSNYYTRKYVRLPDTHTHQGYSTGVRVLKIRDIQLRTHGPSVYD